MRILTPNEQRQVEQLKSFIIKGYGHNDIGGWTTIRNVDIFVIDINDNQELWLNILDMVLQTQDAMRESWRKSNKPTIEVRG